MAQKRCNRCKTEKELSEFHINRGTRDGLTSFCKACNNARAKDWQDKNPEKSKAKKAAWYRAHKELTIQRAAQWAEDNRTRHREQQRAHDNRIRSTPRGHLDFRMGSAIRDAIGSIKAGRRWLELVDYTIEELMQHLESKFLPGMTWDNYGNGGWHIDHKVPRDFFIYETTEEQEFKYCWSLDNLQPMWEKDNLSKGYRLLIDPSDINSPEINFARH